VPQNRLRPHQLLVRRSRDGELNREAIGRERRHPRASRRGPWALVQTERLGRNWIQIQLMRVAADWIQIQSVHVTANWIQVQLEPVAANRIQIQLEPVAASWIRIQLHAFATRRTSGHRIERCDRRRDVRPRRDARDQELEVGLARVRRRREDPLDVLVGQVRGEHDDPGDMQPTIGDRREDLREPSGRARGANPLVRDLRGHAQVTRAVREHRRARRLSVQVTRVDLRDVREERRRRVAVRRDQRIEVGEQGGIGDMRERERGHDSTYHDDFRPLRMREARRSASKNRARTLDVFARGTAQYTCSGE
jgi:hypothetical protein